MKINEIFNLNKTQAELDFVDIDVDTDIPLFLDPFFLSLRNDPWSINATRTVKNFFQHLINLVRQNRIRDARNLFSHLHEPNQTCLGMSQGSPQGKGVGLNDAEKIFDSIIQSRAIQTGLLKDLEDNILFVENFGKDKLSDMTTNIIRKHLISYTKSQCNLHGITLTPSVPSGFFWNPESVQWESEYNDMLIIEDKKILLVPKGIVSFSKDYTPDRYYNHFVLNFLQNEQLQLNSSFVQYRKDGTAYVTKKDMKEENPCSKEFLRSFTLANPQVLDNFRNQTTPDSLSNYDISDIDFNELKNHLIDSLNNIPAGTANATNYHRLIKGILELIFYPNLINPILEREINEGRKRIDITFDNASKNGIFFRLYNNMNIPCPYIMVECKNYSNDPANPELDQLSGRFSVNRGKVGFLLCRTFNNKDLFIKRCQDTYRDKQEMIIPLCDEDIICILDNITEHDLSYVDRFLSDIIRSIALN